MAERLHKYLASCGVSSRRKAEVLIEEGRVTVNNRIVTTLGSLVRPEQDIVLLDGKRVSREAKRLYLFHKPKGVVSTMSDPQGRRCVSSFTENLSIRVFPVGRLDFDVCGLLLLTNDGAFCERMLHPRYQVERTYWARVKGKADQAFFSVLKTGVELEDGDGRAQHARLLTPSVRVERLLGRGGKRSSSVEVVVCEGRHHFVKRLLECSGHPVQSLARVSFGKFALGRLSPGKMREIKDYESLLE